jgi:hypothetical protein
MYKLFAIITLTLGLTLSGCSNSRGNIDGTWIATLTNPDNSPAFAFQTNFTGSGGGVLTVTSLSFTTSGTCFNTPPFTEVGTVSLSGDYNGHVSGSFGLTITTQFSSGTNNVLVLNGIVNNSTITGTWTLTGSTGCSGNGLFTAMRGTAGA